jgi:hypothetical protein
MQTAKSGSCHITCSLKNVQPEKMLALIVRNVKMIIIRRAEPTIRNYEKITPVRSNNRAVQKTHAIGPGRKARASCKRSNS